MVDYEQIVNVVYSYKPLWDTAHPLHQHGGVLDNIWTDAADHLGLSGKELQTKWKSLKSHFRGALMQYPNDVFVSGYKLTWPRIQQLMYPKDIFFKDTEGSSSSHQDEKSQLQFVSMMLDPQNCDLLDEETSSATGSSNRSFSDASLMYCDLSDEELSSATGSLNRFFSDTSLMYCDLSDEEHSSATGSLNRSFSDASLMNSNTMRLEEPSSSVNPEKVDDDYHFFMSLLPTMKKFNDLQKMRIRSRFQQTILEELTQMEFLNG